MGNIRKRILCLTLTLLFVLGGGTVRAQGNENAVSDARKGVVRIIGIGPDGSSWIGTGFAVGTTGTVPDTFVTNWHVVTGNGAYGPDDVRLHILLDDETLWHYEYDQKTASWVFSELQLGDVVECEVLSAENEYPDVAVIRSAEPVEGVKPLKLQKVDPEQVSVAVRAIGYPGSADDIRSDTESHDVLIKGSMEAVSVSGGVISRCQKMERMGNSDCIVHDAHINGGNSGGPLVLENGSVIGINTYTYGEYTSEYSVSIYIDYAMEILDRLEIPYETAGGGATGGGFPWVPVVGAAVVLAALGLLLYYLKSKKKTQKDVQISAVSPQQETPDREHSGKISASVREASAATEKMELRLQGISGTFAGRRFPLEGEVKLGRDPQKCNFVYPSGTKGVSSLHCVIRTDARGAVLADAGSTYGTFLNGRKLAQNQPAPLQKGDKISLGSPHETFQVTGKGGV